MELTSRGADFSKKEDRDIFTEWVFNTPNNLFDQKVIFYPTTNTIMVERDGAPIFFGPFQLVVMLESLAPKPDISPREMAAALAKFHEGIVNVCRQMKLREVYFVCADERISQFVLNHPIEVAGEKIRYTEINGEKKDEQGNVVCPSLADWAKEHGYPGQIKRTLKLKLPGPEDKLKY
ncbi:MAG TPA: hypothetical protein VHA06_09070 [Candidatus Angelobacter sp.]|jgi:hypothetical protein|nr:hypothetical protein [Candidatus Angelobacter sp.]